VDIPHLYTSVFCEHCGHHIQVPVYCKNRFCSVCGLHRNMLIRYKLTEFLRGSILKKYDSFKFLTLTIPNDDNLLCQVKELITAFRRLRQRAVWKKHVRGGATVIEVKPGKEGWHAHLHIVIESGYIPFAVLLREWKAVSSGQGVYIKKIHGAQVVHYITKYLTKTDCSEAEQQYMTHILKGVRLFQPFGNWFDPINKIKKHQVYCPDCHSVCWCFGNPTAWFSRNTDDATVIEGISPRKTVKPDRQTTLFPDACRTTMLNDVG
jgi:Replication protein